MVTAGRRLPGRPGSTRSSAGLGELGRSGRGTQEDGVTFSNRLPCRAPPGPALGTDSGKAQHKPGCTRAEVVLVLAFHQSMVMGHAPSSILPHGDPQPLRYTWVLLAIAVASFMLIFKLVILSLHWINI